MKKPEGIAKINKNSCFMDLVRRSQLQSFMTNGLYRPLRNLRQDMLSTVPISTRYFSRCGPLVIFSSVPKF